jgi:small subunit ribosomal protein S6
MYEYELVNVLRVGLDDSRVKKIESRIEQAFKSHGGVLLRRKEMGEKSLAYPIHKEMKGRYVLFQMMGRGGMVDEIESHLRISSDVLRFLTVKVGKNVDLKKRKKEIDEQISKEAVEEKKEASVRQESEEE